MSRQLSAPDHLRCEGQRAFTLLELVVVITIIAALAGLIISNVNSSDGPVSRGEHVALQVTMETLRDALLGGPQAPGYVADMKGIPGFDVASIRIGDLLAEGGQPAFAVSTERGWRGPYLGRYRSVSTMDPAHFGRFPASSDRRFPGDRTFLERGFFHAPDASFYGTTADLAVGDPWGNPIVLQIPPPEAFVSPAAAQRWRFARLVSAGPDGILSTPRFDALENDPETQRADARLAGRRANGSTAARGDDLVLFLNRPDIYEP